MSTRSGPPAQSSSVATKTKTARRRRRALRTCSARRTLASSTGGLRIIALAAREPGPDSAASSFGGQYPRPHLPGRRVPEVLGVATLQLRHPVLLVVLPKADDLPVRHLALSNHERQKRRQREHPRRPYTLPCRDPDRQNRNPRSSVAVPPARLGYRTPGSGYREARTRSQRPRRNPGRQGPDPVVSGSCGGNQTPDPFPRASVRPNWSRGDEEERAQATSWGRYSTPARLYIARQARNTSR
jgi:hypothetical protein